MAMHWSPGSIGDREQHLERYMTRSNKKAYNNSAVFISFCMAWLQQTNRGNCATAPVESGKGVALRKQSVSRSEQQHEVS
jgi:hypothetical protein